MHPWLRKLELRYGKQKHFDEDIPPDIEEVLDVAAHLDIKEFDVFRLAYAWWHGQDSSDAAIEPHFVRYMFHDVVPPWVRQFTRMALKLKERGELEPERFGIVRREADAESISKGIRYSIILVAAMSFLFLVAHLSQHLLYGRCMYPPCY